MPLWFHHAAQFLVAVFVRWYTFLGTSPGGVVAQIVVFLLTEVQGGWWKLQTWRVNWRGGLKRGAYALGVVWVTAFLACVVTTVYDDHQGLVARLHAAVTEKDELSRKLGPTSDKCWIETVSMKPLPLRLPNGAVSASQGMLFCNRAYSVPYTLLLEFDQALVGSAPVVIPIGGPMGKYIEELNDNTLSVIFDAPSIEPYKPFSIVVYGKTHTLPLLKSLTIKTASTVQQFQ